MNINIREVLGGKEEKKGRWLAEAVEEELKAEKEAGKAENAGNDESPSEAEVQNPEPDVLETETSDQDDTEEPADPADEGSVVMEEVDESDEIAETDDVAETETPAETEGSAETYDQPEEQDTSEIGDCAELDDEAEESSEESAEIEGGKAEPADNAEKNEEKKIAAFGKKYGWITGIAASFIVLLAVTFAYTSLVPREVHATINGKEYSTVTKEYTIDGFLEGENIEYCEEDYISKPVSTYIYDGISFDLKHATDFKVTADGKTKKYKTLERNVGDALKDCGVKVGDKDIVTPAVDTSMGDDMEIVVQRVTTKQVKVEEKVPFETVEKEDSSLNEGSSKVVTEGVEGLDEVTYEITYIDGVESSRKEIARTSITAAVDEVVAKGTRINFNGKSYSRKLVVKAYAYTGGGRTAMGTKARVGEIAVDPSVIPLGSRVYIEGVGYRRAEDTGGNIKGNTIDIYMNSESECLRWGMRYVTVYIE